MIPEPDWNVWYGRVVLILHDVTPRECRPGADPTLSRDALLPGWGEYACEGLNVLWAFLFAFALLTVYVIFEEWRDR